MSQIRYSWCQGYGPRGLVIKAVIIVSLWRGFAASRGNLRDPPELRRAYERRALPYRPQRRAGTVVAMGTRFTVITVWVLLLGACTATDSTTGPVATPQPTSSFATPPPSPPSSLPPTAAPVVPKQGSDDRGRPTIDELVASPFPLNIAHAGGDLIGPQSTLFAMAQSIEEGAVMLELGVQLTSDGVLVVHHDTTVDQTTDATGRLAALRLAELQALDNAYWFSPACWPCQDRPIDEYIYRGIRTGEVEPPEGFSADDFRVPTLREAVERFPTVAFDIEIKGSGFAALPTAVALSREITALGIAESVIVVSVDDGAIGAFETLTPGVATSPGTQALADWLLLGTPLDDRYRVVQVAPEFNGLPVLTDAFWDAVARDELVVWVWMNDPQLQENVAFYQELIAAGADGIIAGRPNELAAAGL